MTLPASSFTVVPLSATTVAGLGEPPDGTPGLIYDPATGAAVQLVRAPHPAGGGRWLSQPFPLVRQSGNHVEGTGPGTFNRSWPDWSLGEIPDYRALYTAGLRLRVHLFGLLGFAGGPAVGDTTFAIHLWAIEQGAFVDDLGESAPIVCNPVSGTLEWRHTNDPLYGAFAPLAADVAPNVRHAVAYASIYNGATAGQVGVWQECGAMGRWESP